MKTKLPAFLTLALLFALPSVAQGPNLSIRTATILSGASLSAAVAIADDPIVAIRMPATWTAAVLTFQASEDGTNYGDVYNLNGDETTAAIPSGGALTSKYIAMSPWEFAGARYIKIRSGTGAAPVTQGADRVITLITRSNQ